MPRTCQWLLCMSPSTFVNFFMILRNGGYLSDTKRSSLEVQVAKTLYIFGHNAKNVTLGSFFMRSDEIVSRDLHSSQEFVLPSPCLFKECNQECF